MFDLRIIGALLGAGICLGKSSASADEFTNSISPFLTDNCLECHDDLMEEGGLDLSRFFTEDDAMAERSVWASVYEKVESHQMPPPKGSRQPSDEERAAILAWIEEIAARPDPALGQADPGKPVFRRLTRLEYNNTVRDLFGLDLDIFIFPERLKFADRSYFQPDSASLGKHVRVPMREYGGKYRVLVAQAGLPGDSRAAHGFRNRGEEMDFSPLLLEKYVQLASDIAHAEELPRRSTRYAALLGLDSTSLPSPAERKPQPEGYAETPIVGLAPSFAPDLVQVRKAPDSPGWIEGFRDDVATAFREGRGGVIDISDSLGGTTVAGKGGLLKAQFGQRIVTVNPNEDLWLVGFQTAKEASDPLLMANREKGSKTFELTFEIRSADEEEGIERIGLCVLGRRGQSGTVTLTATFTDGTAASTSAEISEGDEGTTFFSFASVPGESIRRLQIDGSRFSGDYVLVDDIGFITDGLPQSAEPLAQPEPASAEKPREEKQPSPPRDRLAAFVEEAFRRPVEAAEVDRFFSLYENVRKGGADEAGAMKVAVQAVLASPGFLFHEMNGKPDEGRKVTRLEDFELANRLSYFLWSSLPDRELAEAAKAGRLSSDPAELERQALRMLRDPRAKELSESFATQWLRLDQLYTAKPDRDLYGNFYSGPQGKTTLHSAALVEPLLLFETVMVEDRSILEFIDPGYTWVNEQLLKLYEFGDPARNQIREITGARGGEEAVSVAVAGGQGNREVQKKKDENAEWYRLELPDANRGGFLTMSGPLTVTSLPFRTSPVKRGAWLLETVFNRPPTEPKVAFVIENDTKEAALTSSIREKFEDHRSKAACYSCHIRLDPPGFALETFDPIGQWRESDGGVPVDAGGEWNGAGFSGPSGFKKIISREPHEFTRGFVEHLLSYALSRKLEIYDMPVVTEIQRRAEADGWRFSRVVAEIVKSYPFTHVRASDPDKTPLVLLDDI